MAIELCSLLYAPRTTAVTTVACPVYYGPDDVVLAESQVRAIVETAFTVPSAQDSIILRGAMVPGYCEPDGTKVVKLFVFP